MNIKSHKWTAKEPLSALKEENKILLMITKNPKNFVQSESAFNFNLGLTSPIENQGTQDLESILHFSMKTIKLSTRILS